MKKLVIAAVAAAAACLAHAERIEDNQLGAAGYRCSDLNPLFDDPAKRDADYATAVSMESFALGYLQGANAIANKGTPIVIPKKDSAFKFLVAHCKTRPSMTLMGATMDLYKFLLEIAPAK